MRDDIDRLLAAHGGAASRDDLRAALSRASLDDRVRRGELVAVFPRAYVRPWDTDDPYVALAAALRSVGGEVALSHLTALARWGLPVATGGPIHVTAYNPRHPRGVAGRLVVHRTLRPLQAVERDGLVVVRPELALVTSWALATGSAARAPVIEAARNRLVAPGRLLELAERMWWIRGIVGFRQLVALLDAGCESELELWGYTNVFNVPGLDDASRQLAISVDGRRYRLDMAYEEERLAVELDGRKYHSSPEQRERDIARDVAVATAGWQTIRFSHDRLTNDIAGCRRDTLAVRAARRRLIA